MPQPPVCRFCKKAEWSHLCKGQVVPAVRKTSHRVIAAKGKKARVVQVETIKRVAKP